MLNPDQMTPVDRERYQKCYRTAESLCVRYPQIEQFASQFMRDRYVRSGSLFSGLGGTLLHSLLAALMFSVAEAFINPTPLGDAGGAPSQSQKPLAQKPKPQAQQKPQSQAQAPAQSQPQSQSVQPPAAPSGYMPPATSQFFDANGRPLSKNVLFPNRKNPHPVQPPAAPQQQMDPTTKKVLQKWGHIPPDNTVGAPAAPQSPQAQAWLPGDTPTATPAQPAGKPQNKQWLPGDKPSVDQQNKKVVPSAANPEKNPEGMPKLQQGLFSPKKAKQEGGGGSGDSEHPRWKAGDPKGRGGQFAPKHGGKSKGDDKPNTVGPPEAPPSMASPKQESKGGFFGQKQNWNAGMNRGTAGFESEEHRDMHEIGSKSRSGNVSKDKSAADKNAKQDRLDQMINKWAQHHGVSPDEIRNHAAKTHQGTKDQMKGVKDGEHRDLKYEPFSKGKPANDNPETPQGETAEPASEQPVEEQPSESPAPQKDAWDHLWDEIESGQETDTVGEPSEFHQAAKQVKAGGGLQSKDDLRQMHADYQEARELQPMLTPKDYKSLIDDMVKKHVSKGKQPAAETVQPPAAPHKSDDSNIFSNPAHEARKKQQAEQEVKKSEESPASPDPEQQKEKLKVGATAFNPDKFDSRKSKVEEVEKPTPPNKEEIFLEVSNRDWSHLPENERGKAIDEARAKEWKQAKNKHEAAMKKFRYWQKNADTTKNQRIEKSILDNDIEDVDGFKNHLEEMHRHEMDQWTKTRSLRAEVRRLLGHDSNKRKKTAEGKKGYEDYRGDVEEALGGNIDEATLSEHFGVDPGDRADKVWEFANADDEPAPSFDDPDWIEKHATAFREQEMQPRVQVDRPDGPVYNDDGEVVPFSRQRHLQEILERYHRNRKTAHYGGVLVAELNQWL